MRQQEINPFTQKLYNQSFNRDYEEQQQDLYHMMSDTHQKLEQSFKQFGLSLQNERDIDRKHSQNMMDLEALNQKMLSSLHGKKDEEEMKYVEDFGQTRGYNQSIQLQNQIKGIGNTNQNLLQKFGTFQNQVVNEEHASDLDREENVFENNISEESQTQLNQSESEIQPSHQQILFERANPNPYNQTFNRQNTPMFSLDNNLQFL